MGLGQIQGIGKRTIESILAARPFGCLGDLVVRSHVRIAEAENLIRAGALDFTGRTRPVLMLVLHSIFEKAKRLSAREGLFRIALPTPSLPQVRDYSDVQRFRDEWEMLNLSVHHHPLYEVRPLLDSMKVRKSGNLQGRVGKRILNWPDWGQLHARPRPRKVSRWRLFRGGQVSFCNFLVMVSGPVSQHPC